MTISILDINFLQAGQSHVITPTGDSDELTPYRVCELQFPMNKIQRSALCMVTEWYASNRSQAYHAGPAAPYRSGHDHLICLAALYEIPPGNSGNSEPRGEEQCVITIPLSTFEASIQRSIDHGARVLTWEEWSPLGVSILCEPATPATSSIPDGSATGTTVVWVREGHHNKSLQISLHEFSRWTARADSAGESLPEEASSPYHSVTATRALYYEPGRIFPNDIVTTTLLPRIFDLQLKLGEGMVLEDFRTLSAGEDGILLKYFVSVKSLCPSHRSCS